MNKIYNNYDKIASDLNKFFQKIGAKLSKPLRKNLSYIILAMSESESVVTADMAKVIKSSNFSNNDASVQKRIWRFFNNEHINIYSLYNKIIKYVINNISNVRHNEVIITLDHMFTKNNFVTLMFTLKIDKQGIPIWFRTDRTLSNCHLEIQKNSRKKLFSEKFLMDAIDEVIDLLSPLNTPIVFLADRWFFNLKILKHIQDKNQYFCFRAKANSSVKFLMYDKKEGHNVYKHLSDLHSQKHHSTYYKDLELGDLKLKCNLSISRGVANDGESWYIVSNIEPNQAIRKYSHRFGAIEMFFKSQKTNGFYLESTKTKNSNAFENLYGVVCIATLWLNILGNDYIKNYKHKKKVVNISFNKKDKNGKPRRILSTFKLGLTLFSKLFNSYIDYTLKCNFKLYL